MRESSKFNLWVGYFTDTSNKKTHGNATQSAIKAYGYNPETQYNLASVTGHKNIRKYKVLASMVLEEMGFGFGKLMKVGINKVLKGSYEDWVSFMVLLGYFSRSQSGLSKLRNKKPKTKRIN